MRQQVTIAEIKDRLLEQFDAVISAYVPTPNGSYRNKGRLFTLNPGRADRSVGSFCVTLAGPKQGNWNDYATGAHGDVLDLIGLSLGLDPTNTIKEARAFLGLDTESPELKRARTEAAAKAKARRAEQERDRAAQVEKMRGWARGTWFSAQETLTGTPVDHYLRGRGIDLARLPHMPGAIRYHPECRYYYEAELVDEDTGEIRKEKRWRPLPAMVTAIARGPELIDCHRTYLAFDDQRGIWAKAPVPDAKKVFADYTGGSIRLCGELGPRGGHQKLAKAAEGARVIIAEGIENALSVIMLRALRGQPPAFVLAAGAIWNMAAIELPATVREVTLAADSDAGEQAQAALQKAVAFHASKGRAVRVWRSPIEGEDLNDALRRVLEEERAA
jgi:hypothetical protein